MPVVLTDVVAVLSNIPSIYISAVQSLVEPFLTNVTCCQSVVFIELSEVIITWFPQYALTLPAVRLISNA